MNGGRGARSPTGWIFVLFTFSAIVGGYYEFIRLSLSIMRDRFSPDHDTERAILVIAHLLLGMQLWALFKTMLSRPGDVPPFWVLDKQGFSMTDSTIVRRRYCLMCHVFKPERTHHCSVCNRCVLHMDHHCPWVNNCIGFYNRKFFMLLLFYTLALLYLFVGARLRLAVSAASKLLVWDMKDGLHGSETHTHLRFLSVFSFEFFLSLILTTFFRFHVTIALRGSTTIENVEKRSAPSDFDLGQTYNWQVVFGTNPWLWLLPMYGQSGRPLGDGVVWLRAVETEPHHNPVSDTPKVKDGSKKINLGAQEDALFQLRGSARTPDNRLDTVQNHDESELRDLNRHSANNSSFLSQSFKT